MKRKKRIWIYALLLLAAAAAAVVIWQWRNLRTLHAVITTDEQTAAQNLEAQSEKERTLLEHYDIAITPPTMKQREDLLKGRVSAEEIKQSLGLLPGDGVSAAPEDSGPGNAASEAPSSGTAASDQTAPGGTASNQTAPEDPDMPSQGSPASPAAPDGVPEEPVDPEARAKALLEDCVRSMYALQVDLFEQLGTYRQEAIAEWESLPESERTEKRKLSIGYGVLDRCEALEAQADGEVRALLDACRESLTALGVSADVVDDLWDNYSDEKHAARVYYLSQYA